VDFVSLSPAQGYYYEIYFDNITFVALNGPSVTSRSTQPTVYAPPTLTFDEAIAGAASCTNNCPTQPGTTSGSQKNGGDAGMAAGIAIGVIFGVLLLAAIIVGAIFYYKKHHGSFSSGSVDKNYNMHL